MYKKESIHDIIKEAPIYKENSIYIRNREDIEEEEEEGGKDVDIANLRHKLQNSPWRREGMAD